MKENVYLLIHGFAGNTDEIEYLNQFLLGKGLDTRTVLLAGHGGTRKALRASSYVDWIKSVETVVDELTRTYNYINLLGFSMGGLISVNLASRPEIRRIVFINTPIYIWNVKVLLSDIIGEVRVGKHDKINHYTESAFKVSFKTGVDFLKILSQSKGKFNDMHKQSLIIQCRNDSSAHFKSAGYIKEKIGDPAELLYYDGGCHQVFTMSVELRDLVCGDIYRFLMSDDIRQP